MNIGEKGFELIKNIELVQDKGFDAYTILTQAWHESGAFYHIIGEWNFWGIKKPQSWTGKTVDVKTHEYINNEITVVYDKFIDFNTIQEAIEWWAGLIERLYKKSFENRHLPETFFRELVNPENKYQYATDPKYADKLINLYKELQKNDDLTQLMDLCGYEEVLYADINPDNDTFNV